MANREVANVKKIKLALCTDYDSNCLDKCFIKIVVTNEFGGNIQ